MLPSWVYPSCTQKNTAAFVAGALTVPTGLEMIFMPLAPGILRPPVHWSLVGVGVDYYCKGRVAPDQETAMAAAAAFAGGFVASRVL